MKPKTLRIEFIPNEFEKLKQVKENTGLNWHDFMVKIAEDGVE
jgi:hypothetical protein